MTRLLHMVDRDVPADCLAQLAQLADEGDEVVSVGAPPVGLDAVVRVEHAPLGLASLAGRRMARRVGEFEIVHAWSPRAAQAGAVLARLAGRELLLTLPALPRGNALDELLARLRDDAWTVTVPTRVARDALVARQAPEGRVRVLPPPAAAIDQPGQRRMRVREQLGVGESEFLLAAPAPLVRGAGHEMVAWAHAIVREIGPRLKVVAPDGARAGELRTFADSTGFGPDLHITPADTLDLIAACDAAAFLCKFDCGVQALATALAAGKAIVASSTPDIRELTGDGEGAMLCAPGKAREAAAAILKLVEEPETSAALAARALERGARLTVASARKTLTEIYTSLGADSPA